MHDKPLESDWKTFCRLVPEWRERYLQRVNSELQAKLESEGESPTEKFWNLEQRVRAETKILRNCLDGHRRSGMRLSMLLMYRCGMISDEDLGSFSEELRSRLAALKDI